MNLEDQRTSCPGFLDEYGVWNNGFECPSLAGQTRICCGSESRRYCCVLENMNNKILSNQINSMGHNAYSTIDPTFFISESKTTSILTLPIILTCILILTLIFLFILIILFFCFRYRNRNDKRKHEETILPNTNLLIDHFPFSSPHHQLYLNENNSQFSNPISHLHQQTKDNLTTTTIAPSSTTSTSSTSGRIPSDIYFNEWKDFLITAEQPMNMYPTMSSHSNELNNDHSLMRSNYIYHGKRQPHDIIV